jgi:hypothetical protein
VKHHVTEQSSVRWSLSSSSGRNDINCTFLRRSEKPDALLCQIQVTGEFWQRRVKQQPTDLTSDFEVVLSQVLVDIDALKSLREKLVEWQVNPSSFSVELGIQSGGDQRLSFSIGQEKTLIYSADKPAVTISYSCNASMESKWAWVVDQSCIRLCAESIRDFVRAAETERIGKD